MKRKAFTIIELLVSMVIIGTLSATVLPRIGGAREEAKNTMSKVDKSRELASYVGFDGYTFSSDSAWGGAQNLGNWVHHVWTDITVCREWNCITMQDRNLWATKAGTTCSSADTWACGYHFQRWNNHGFLPCLELNSCWTFPWWETMTTNEKIYRGNYWPQNYFDRAVFSKITSSPYDWFNPSINNLRWWNGDALANNRWYDETNNVAINVEDRQWPCEEWYHVPSIWEWNQVLKYWAEENGIDLYGDGEYEDWLLYNYDWDQNFMQFQEDFKIPFAGFRDNYAMVSWLGAYAYLFSSSPYAGDAVARSFRLNPNEAGASDFGYRTYAFSLRCFKN